MYNVLIFVKTREDSPKKKILEKSLNELGKAQANKTADFLKENKVQYSNHILHSSKLRSKQTAEIIAHKLALNNIVPHPALEPDAPVESLSEIIHHLTNDTLMVGHLPNLELISNFLLSGSYQKPTIAIAPSGIACFKNEMGKWILQWFTNPTLL